MRIAVIVFAAGAVLLGALAMSAASVAEDCQLLTDVCNPPPDIIDPAPPQVWSHEQKGWHRAGHAFKVLKNATNALPRFYEGGILHTGSAKAAGKSSLNRGEGIDSDYTNYGVWAVVDSDRLFPWGDNKQWDGATAVGGIARASNAWPEGSNFYKAEESFGATYIGWSHGHVSKQWGNGRQRLDGSFQGRVILSAHLGAGEESDINGWVSVHRAEGTRYTRRNGEIRVDHGHTLPDFTVSLGTATVNPDGTFARRGGVELVAGAWERPDFQAVDQGGSWGGRFSSTEGADGAPDGVAGTFGAWVRSNTGSQTVLVGAFSADQETN